MTKIILTATMLAILTMPLSGCIPLVAGYLIAKSMEGPSVVTTNCTTKNDAGQQTCTTVTKP